ncbi:MAG: hypothetical protein ACQEVT_18045 [Pseudomonadota bacterium]|uniref:hypothetical protein n=1 Tax=Roseovarius TaxID=74030 RepID=UPI0022A884CD|nr:hypothetical protein [Roseovarius sp. EGI FJ00037]MCZ0812104.1 hypothetical protein [Roseovarius sp. EGI FJ00037]
MSDFIYLLACIAAILAVVQLVRFTRRLIHRSAAIVNASLEAGLISSGFIANAAYLVLFVLIFRICLV